MSDKADASENVDSKSDKSKEDESNLDEEQKEKEKNKKEKGDESSSAGEQLSLKEKEKNKKGKEDESSSAGEQLSQKEEEKNKKGLKDESNLAEERRPKCSKECPAVQCRKPGEPTPEEEEEKRKREENEEELKKFSELPAEEKALRKGYLRDELKELERDLRVGYRFRECKGGPNANCQFNKRDIRDLFDEKQYRLVQIKKMLEQ